MKGHREVLGAPARAEGLKRDGEVRGYLIM